MIVTKHRNGSTSFTLTAEEEAMLFALVRDGRRIARDRNTIADGGPESTFAIDLMGKLNSNTPRVPATEGAS